MHNICGIFLSHPLLNFNQVTTGMDETNGDNCPTPSNEQTDEHQKSNLVHFRLKMWLSGANNFNDS